MYSEEKFSKAIRYICHKADPDKLGSVKLNKILWFAEKFWFDHYGETVTGATFIKKPRGPVASEMAPALASLEQQGILKIKQSRDYDPTIYRCKHEPDMSIFDPRFVTVLDVLMQGICGGHTSITISKKTHDTVWDDAVLDAPISFAAYYREKPTDEDKRMMIEALPVGA